jgi:hypothetical protein
MINDKIPELYDEIKQEDSFVIKALIKEVEKETNIVINIE